MKKAKEFLTTNTPYVLVHIVEGVVNTVATNVPGVHVIIADEDDNCDDPASLSTWQGYDLLKMDDASVIFDAVIDSKYDSKSETIINQRFRDQLIDLTGPQISIRSSNGNITIGQSGLVHDIEDDSDDKCISGIVKFDVEEYKKHYGVTELPTSIDILDLGMWISDNPENLFQDLTYDPPAHEWREEVKAMREEKG